MGENVWSWSTTAATNASADSGINWAEGMLAGAVNNSNRAMMAAHAKALADQSGVTQSSGAANVYAVTTSTDLSAYTNGMRMAFRAHQTNTGSATVNFDSIGAESIVRSDGSALVAGDILNGAIIDLVRVAASSHWRHINGVVPDVLSDTRASGAGIGLTSNSVADIVTGVTLTPGDWDVSGQVGFLPAATTSITELAAGISLSSGVLPSSSTISTPLELRTFNAVVPGTTIQSVGLATARINVNANTQLYLVGRAIFTVSTMTGHGFIWARRANR